METEAVPVPLQLAWRTQRAWILGQSLLVYSCSTSEKSLNTMSLREPNSIAPILLLPSEVQQRSFAVPGKLNTGEMLMLPIKH